MSDQSFTYDEAQNLTANKFTRTGYTFAGWLFDGTTYEDESKVKNLTSEANGSVTLKAVWEVNEYVIEFNGNENTNIVTMGTIKAAYNASAFTLLNNEFTRTGYTFSGWNTKKDGSGTSYGNKESVTMSAVYAAAVAVGQTPEKVVYKDGTTEVESYTAIILYAQWTANKYTVIFDGNGGSFIENEETKTSYSQEFTYDVEQALSANNFTYTGHTFTGWSLTKDGSVEYTDEKVVKNLATGDDGDKEFKLYAVWEEHTYDVEFIDNKFNKEVEDIVGVKYTEFITMPTLTETGYTFLGWNTEDNQTTATYIKGEAYNMLTADDNGTVKLYSVWKEHTYKVDFVDNKFNKDVEDIIGVKYTAGVEMPTLTETGYTFLGWNTEDNQTTATYIKGSTYSKLTADDNGTVTLYSVWKEHTYKVTYDENKPVIGSDENGENIYTAGTISGMPEINPVENILYTGNVTLPTLELKGYTFLGWSTDKDAKDAETINGVKLIANADVNKLTATDNGTVTLYAIWDANEFGITFVPPEETDEGFSGEMEDIELTYDEKSGTYSITLGFTWTGFSFKGWKYELNGIFFEFDFEFDFDFEFNTITLSHTDINKLYDISKENGGELNLAPIWEENSYVVNFEENDFDNINNPTSQTVNYVTDNKDGNRNFVSLPSLSEIGYTLVGWKLNETTTYTNSSVTMKQIIKDNGADPGNNGEFTLTAMWAENSYIVNFKNEFGVIPSQTVNYITDDEAGNRNFVSLPLLSETGYTLVGWKLNETTTYTDSSVTMATIIADLGAEVDKNTAGNRIIYLTADWKEHTYSVDFVDNKFNKDVADIIGVKYTADVEMPTLEATGYTFLGWNTADKQTEATYIKGETYSKLTADDNGTVTLYAVWEANKFSVIFDGNGGSYIDDNDVIKTLYEQTGFTYDAEETLDANKFTYPGHTFKGWSLTENAPINAPIDFADMQELGVENVNSLYARSSNGYVTLYAVWKPTIVELTVELVIYKATADNTLTTEGIIVGVDGGTVTGFGSYNYGSSATLTATAYYGYVFVGFYSDAACETKIDSTINLQGNQTVYAKFIPELYTINVETLEQQINGYPVALKSGYAIANNSGSEYELPNAIETNKFYYGANVQINVSGTNNKFTLVGFGKRSTTISNGTYEVTTLTEGNIWTTTYLKDLYGLTNGSTCRIGAMFNLNTYEITFDSQAGSDEIDWTWSSNYNSSTIEYNDGETIADVTFYKASGSTDTPTLERLLPELQRPGYKFLGWYTTQDYTQGSKVINPASATYENTTYYAAWAPVAHIIGLGATAEEMHKTNGIPTEFTVDLGILSEQQGIIRNENNSYTLSIPSVKGYTFVGWYSYSTTTGYTLLGATAGDYELPEDHIFYAFFKPIATELTVDIKTLGINNKAGNTVVITIGDSKVIYDSSTITSSIPSDNKVTVYYGGEYTVSTTPNGNYYILDSIGWSCTAGLMSSKSTYKFIDCEAETGVQMVDTLEVKFEGKPVTLEIDSNGMNVVMPASVGTIYGSTVTIPLGFNAFIEKYYKNIGFSKDPLATSASIARSSTRTDATITITIREDIVEFNPTTNTARIYAIWEYQPIWLTATDRLGDEYGLDSLDRGYKALANAYATINSTSGIVSVNLDLEGNLAVNSTLTTNAKVTMKPRTESTEPTISVNSKASFLVTNELTISGKFTITGTTTADNGLFDVNGTLNIEGGVVISELTATNIFYVDGSNAVLNAIRTDENTYPVYITDCSTTGNIISVQTGATARFDGKVSNHKASGRSIFYNNASTLNFNGAQIEVIDITNSSVGEEFSVIYATATDGDSAIITFADDEFGNSVVIITNNYRAVYEIGTGTADNPNVEVSGKVIVEKYEAES